MKNKKLVLVLAMVMLMGASLGVFVGCSGDNEAAKYSVGIKINPELELVVNGNNKVISVIKYNSDAETLLVGVDLVGMTAEDATEKVVKLASISGYIDVDAAAGKMSIDVTGDPAFVNKVKDKVTVKAQKYLEECEINYTIALQKGLDEAKVRLVKRLMRINPELKEAELNAMTNDQLVKLLAENAAKDFTNNPALEAWFTTVRDTTKQAMDFVMSATKKLIATLQQQIETATGEELTKLKADLADAQAKLDKAYADYQVKIEEFRVELTAKYNAILAQFKTELTAKINSNKDKLQKHLDKVQSSGNKVMDDMQEWLDKLAA